MPDRYRCDAIFIAIRRASSRVSALICINAHPFNSCLVFFMISFTYRCPRTGQNVHGHVVNDLIGSETYEPVTCTECGHTHLVNLKTGELLEEAEIVTR